MTNPNPSTNAARENEIHRPSFVGGPHCERFPGMKITVTELEITCDECKVKFPLCCNISHAR